MKAPCTVSRMRNGSWLVRHSSSTLGTVVVAASSREEALTKMRNELQYRSELCPCSGASGDTVELQVSEDFGPTKRGDAWDVGETERVVSHVEAIPRTGAEITPSGRSPARSSPRRLAGR